MSAHCVWIVLLCLYRIAGILSLEICSKNSEFKPNTIVLPRQALNAGAKFLNKLPVESIHECYFACCHLPLCTNAVYKSKSPEECFLFDCRPQNVCAYGRKENYDLIVMFNRSDHQSGLTSFSLFYSLTANLGETCDRYNGCAPDHSVCSDGQCVCQSGWLQKESLCVLSVCKSPDTQFQCSDSSTCVAIYDRCNGIAECPDGSDEFDCPEGSSSARLFEKHVTKLPAQMQPKEVINRTREFRRHISTHDTYKTPWSSQDFYRDSNDDRSVLEPDELSDALDSDLIEDQSSSSVIPRTPTRIERRLPDRKFHPLRIPVSRHELKRPLHVIDDSSGYPISRNSNYDDGLRFRYSHYLPYTEEPTALFGPSGSLGKKGKLALWERSVGPPSHTSHQRHQMEAYPTGGFPHMLDSDDPNDFAGTFEGTIVDPSVLRTSRRWTRPHKPKIHAVPVSSDNKPSTDEDVKGAHGTASSNQNPDDVGHKHSDQLHSVSASPTEDALTMLQQTRGQSHTAALVFAFSLGLVCCFIGLLLVEWRRRLGRRPWAIRHQSASIPVISGDRGKVSGVPGRVNTSRARQFSSNDEDRKPLYDGLAL